VSAEIVAHLLDEMEEYYGAFDHYPLYLLGWELNDQKRTAEQKHQLARQAYEEFTSRHTTKIVWVPWPLDLAQARPFEPGTPLDFDLDPEGPADVLLQVLVPDQAVSV
jgi:hypothetical protein